MNRQFIDKIVAKQSYCTGNGNCWQYCGHKKGVYVDCQGNGIVSSIEERLTLYVHELEKRIEELTDRIDKLERMIDTRSSQTT